MQLHANLHQRAVIDSHNLAWSPSPMAGVERRMLERSGEDVARATSLVRYAPGSHFERHSHGGGEEILVLEGSFSDELGDDPTGTDLRNPVGSEHAPYSAAVCTILVLDTHSSPWRPGLVIGLEVLPPHGFGREGDYPAGSWLRNPPGSIHRAWSDPGCTIWVNTGHLPFTRNPDDSEA